MPTGNPDGFPLNDCGSLCALNRGGRRTHHLNLLQDFADSLAARARDESMSPAETNGDSNPLRPVATTASDEAMGCLEGQCGLHPLGFWLRRCLAELVQIPRCGIFAAFDVRQLVQDAFLRWLWENVAFLVHDEEKPRSPVIGTASCLLQRLASSFDAFERILATVGREDREDNFLSVAWLRLRFLRCLCLLPACLSVRVAHTNDLTKPDLDGTGSYVDGNFLEHFSHFHQAFSINLLFLLGTRANI